MRSKKFGFLGHYKRIKVEGLNLANVVNKCIKDDITLRNIKCQDPLETTVEIEGDDFGKLKKAVGHLYKISVIKEGGLIPVFRSMKANIITVAGAFLLGALIFYQSLFVAEIRIDGYRSIAEADIRATLAKEGLYEGAKKEDNYDHIKSALYKNYSKITWVSIFEEGRLIKVDVAEAGKEEEKPMAEEAPVNIVAARSGMIEKILPLQGKGKVQKGDYVNAGDILISGRIKYQSSDYSKGDGFFTMYSHAKGQVFAKTPKRITYYFEKNRRIKEPTGKAITGLYIKIGDKEMDTAKAFCKYEASVRKEEKLIEFTRPIPLSLSLVRIDEVKLKEKPRDIGAIKRTVDAAIRQYGRDELQKGEEITSQSVDYCEGVGTIGANVLLEILEDIGEEKEIEVKKDKKEQQ